MYASIEIYANTAGWLRATMGGELRRYQPILCTLICALGSTPVLARPLTLKSADRAIDLALQAEMAGDYAGASKALEGLITSAKTSREISAKARLQAWMRGMKLRKAAFEKHGRSARGYSEAFSTLRGFGLPRSEQLWRRALKDISALDARFSSLAQVSVHPNLVVGVKDPRPMVGTLKQRLVERGAKVVPKAPLTVRLNVDAHKVEESASGRKVTAEGSVSLRTPQGETLRSIGRKRTETRRTEAAARRFAVRMVVDELARGLVFQLRALTLQRVANPT